MTTLITGVTGGFGAAECAIKEGLAPEQDVDAAIDDILWKPEYKK